MKIIIINGPNLNLLGKREPDVYGAHSYEDICAELYEFAAARDFGLEIYQYNSEGDIIDRIHASIGNTDHIIINPGAYTHYSLAIRDAIKATGIKTAEVHLSNIHAREEFRKVSVIAPVCTGQISGFGATGYRLAILAALGEV